jgi:hypothetical protein
MLLKTIGWIRKKGDYPTMFMIMNGLMPNPFKAISYFQYDSLWKSLQMASTLDRTHDVYDRKGVNREEGKSCPLFSIGYLEENDGNCVPMEWNPTMCMMGRDLV